MSGYDKSIIKASVIINVCIEMKFLSFRMWSKHEGYGYVKRTSVAERF